MFVLWFQRPYFRLTYELNTMKAAANAIAYVDHILNFGRAESRLLECFWVWVGGGVVWK